MTSKYRKYSDKRAAELSKELNLKVQKNSGAGVGKRGDLYGPEILIEDKVVFNQPRTFSIKRDWILKISEEAFRMGKFFWALFLHDYEDTNGADDLVIISRRTFDILYENYREKENN